MVLCRYNLKWDQHSAFLFQRRLLSTHSPECFFSLYFLGGENRMLFFKCWKDSRMCKSFFGVALVSTQMWPLTLKQDLYFTGLVGVIREESQEFDAIRPAFWDLYAGKVLFSLKANKRQGLE